MVNVPDVAVALTAAWTQEEYRVNEAERSGSRYQEVQIHLRGSSFLRCGTAHQGLLSKNCEFEMTFLCFSGDAAEAHFETMLSPKQ